MNPETAKLLEELAAKLGTTSAYIWQVLVRQAYVAGWINLGYDLIAIIFLVVALLYVRRGIDWPEYDDEPSQALPKVIVTVVTGVLLLIGSITCLMHLLGNGLDFVYAFGNPEYWALKEIGEILKKG